MATAATTHAPAVATHSHAAVVPSSMPSSSPALPIIIEPSPIDTSHSSSSDAFIHTRIESRIRLLESAILQIPRDRLEYRDAEYELSALKLHAKQAQVRAQMERHAREAFRHRAQRRPFEVKQEIIDIDAMEDDNEMEEEQKSGGSRTKEVIIKLFDPSQFETRAKFFDADESLAKAASVTSSSPSPVVKISNGAASSSSSSAAADEPPPLIALKAPAHSQSSSFTSSYLVPSLRKQLPPPVVPKGLPPALQPPKRLTNTSTAVSAARLATVNNPTGAANVSSALKFHAAGRLSTAAANATPTSSTLTPVLHQQPFATQQSHNAAQQHVQFLVQQAQAAGSPMSQEQQSQMFQHLLKQYGTQISLSSIQANYAQQKYNLETYQLQRSQFTQITQASRAAEKEKRRLRKIFLAKLKSHHQVFFAAARERKRVAKNLANAAFKIEADIERKKQMEESKQERAALRDAEQRLAALKANDLTAYAELIKSCKSQRIQLLLEETAKWELKLKNMIAQKRASGRREEQVERERLAKAKAKRMEEEKKRDEMKDDEVESSASAAAASSSSTAAAPVPLEQALDDSVVLELDEEKVSQPRLMTGGELKPYQLTGIQWLVSLYNNHLNGILADEMGLGKTIQSIGLIAYLMEAKGVLGPYLVIGPLSTLKNWRSEFTKWAPSIKVVWYNGTPDVRSAMWKTSLLPHTYNVVLTSYEYILNKHDRSKLGAVQWKYIIIDEGHRMKNSQSKLSVTLSEKYHSPHRLILSGTPLQNSLKELWSLLNFLLPTIFDSSESFEEWFSKPFEKQGLKKKNDDENSAESLLNQEESILIIHRLHAILRPFLLRRLKADVASQLPPKTEIILKSILTPWQSTLYDQIRSQGTLQTVDASGQIKSKRMQSTFVQLRKTANHPYLFELTNPDFQTNYVVGTELVRSSGKFDQLHRMIPKLIQTGHKILLFSQMSRILDLIEDYCEWQRIKFVRLDGSCAASQRSEAQDAFNAPNSEIHLFIMTTRAGGLGLNLQVADTVILFDSDWNPQADLQAADRAHRLGQRREVRVFRLMALCPVEEAVISRAQKKLQMDQMIIQSGKFDADNKKMSAGEKKSILQDILTTKITLGVRDAPSDSEINRMMARSEDEFLAFERMDKEIDKQDREIWAKEKPGTSYPGRFITDPELPVHVREVDLTKLLNEDEEENKGKRSARNNVSYGEALSEREWLKCVDAGIDPKVYAQKKREREKKKALKQSKSTSSKAAAASSDGEEDDEENDEDEEDEVDELLLNESDSSSNEGEENEDGGGDGGESSDSDASFPAARRGGRRTESATPPRKGRKSATPTPASAAAASSSSSSAPRPRGRAPRKSATPTAMEDDDYSDIMIVEKPSSTAPAGRSNRKRRASQDADESRASPAPAATPLPTRRNARTPSASPPPLPPRSSASPAPLSGGRSRRSAGPSGSGSSQPSVSPPATSASRSSSTIPASKRQKR